MKNYHLEPIIVETLIGMISPKQKNRLPVGAIVLHDYFSKTLNSKNQDLLPYLDPLYPEYHSIEQQRVDLIEKLE